MYQREFTSEAVVPQGDSIDLLSSAIRFYRSAVRRKFVIVSCLVISCSLGAAYYLTATRLYQSRAELIVLQTGGDVLDHEQRRTNDVHSQMPNFERIIQSDSVLKEALKTLPHEHYIDFVGVAPDRWLDQFRRRLSLTTLRSTNVISVSFRSLHSETAYIVVDALLTASLKYMNSMHQDTSQELLQIITKEKVKTETELRAKQAELLRLRRNSQVLFGSNEEPTNVLNERVFELNKALIEARKQTVEAKALWVAIENAVQRGEGLQDFAIKLNENLGQKILESQMGMNSQDAYAVARMEQELVDTRSELIVLRETHGENHPRVRELVEKVRQAEGWLQARPQQISDAMTRMSNTELAPRLVSIARRRFEIAQAREQEVLRQYQQESDAALEIGHQLAQVELLQHEVAELEKYYNSLLDNIKSQALDQESGVVAKTITPPSIDRRAVTPKLALTGLASLMFGLFCGGALVYVLDFFDDRFHSPEDLKQTLATPILAMIRKLPELDGSGIEAIYPYIRPNAVESESFRTLRTTIDFATEETRRLTISSTQPSDGKTTVISSLAVTFAQAGKRTLLIDGDMRRPGTTRLFDLTMSEGLSSVLRETAPIAESAPSKIVASGLENLDILPAGPRPTNPVELLSGERLAELVAWAETKYNQILIDAPPSLAVADVQVIGRVVDAAILIVRPEKNKRRMVIRASEALVGLGCRMLGVVINAVEQHQGGDYGFGYGYGYGDDGAYGYYGGDSSTDEHRLAA